MAFEFPIHLTFQYDEVGLLLLDKLGEDCIMWESDFPYPDGVRPHAQEFIERQFGHLPAATKHNIVYGNAAAFYRLLPS